MLSCNSQSSDIPKVFSTFRYCFGKFTKRGALENTSKKGGVIQYDLEIMIRQILKRVFDMAQEYQCYGYICRRQNKVQMEQKD